MHGAWFGCGRNAGLITCGVRAASHRSHAQHGRAAMSLRCDLAQHRHVSIELRQTGCMPADAVATNAGPALGCDAEPGLDPDVDLAECIEGELRTLLSRARSFSVELAQVVHPDLEPAVYVLLVQLAERGEVRAVDLAALRGVTKGVVSRQVDTLRQMGLIERRNDPTDGRARTIMVTRAGRDAVRKAQRARHAYVERMLQHCGSAEKAAIARTLARLNELMT
jgi:DNA-binding MarR family transcriptional regulator